MDVKKTSSPEIKIKSRSGVFPSGGRSLATSAVFFLSRQESAGLPGDVHHESWDGLQGSHFQALPVQLVILPVVHGANSESWDSRLLLSQHEKARLCCAIIRVVYLNCVSLEFANVLMLTAAEETLETYLHMNLQQIKQQPVYQISEEVKSRR